VSVDLSEVAAAARRLADICSGTSETQAWSTDVAASMVVKSVPDSRFTLSVAYPALRADKKVALDGRRDAIQPDALEKTAWEWLARSRRIGLYHGDYIGLPGGANEGHGEAVESYLWRCPQPWVLKGADGVDQTIEYGDWLLGVRWDLPTWDLIKSGRIDGFSVQGKADIRKASPQLLALLRS
jgi:hypothetical protein